MPNAFAGDSPSASSLKNGKPVSVEVLTPAHGDNAGIGGARWFVDLDIEYPGGLAKAGFSGLQLTGPAAHNNSAPFPGAFSTGRDDRLPGLVVLTSTTNATLPGFSGPGTNLANLFNLTGVTNRTTNKAEIWDTWIVGTPIAGKDVNTVLTVAVVDDLNHNGIYDDAPAVLTDLNGDGSVDARDLKKLGVASNIETVQLHLNGDGA
ncbi:MAG: hypothetical protein ACYCV4_08890 [Dermatophilaceae bacterium]